MSPAYQVTTCLLGRSFANLSKIVTVWLQTGASESSALRWERRAVTLEVLNDEE